MLTIHVTASIGWGGAIVAYIALQAPILTGSDPQTVRASYLMTEPVIVYGILPLGLASLVTGIVQSLGTQWGLFRH